METPFTGGRLLTYAGEGSVSCDGWDLCAAAISPFFFFISPVFDSLCKSLCCPPSHFLDIGWPFPLESNLLEFLSMFHPLYLLLSHLQWMSIIDSAYGSFSTTSWLPFLFF